MAEAMVWLPSEVEQLMMYRVLSSLKSPKQIGLKARAAITKAFIF